MSRNLEARIRALEGVGGAEDVTVIIRNFGSNVHGRSESFADGSLRVERLPAEDGDSFRARALTTLRAGRRGLLVFTEHVGN